MRAILLTALAMACAAGAGAQEAALEQVLGALETSTRLAEETVKAVNAFQGDQDPEAFLRRISDIQNAFGAIVVLVATTQPPQGARRLAMLVAMGAEGIELALRYYIYGLLARDADYLGQGDLLFRRGLAELTAAEEMRERM